MEQNNQTSLNVKKENVFRQSVRYVKENVQNPCSCSCIGTTAFSALAALAAIALVTSLVKPSLINKSFSLLKAPVSDGVIKGFRIGVPIFSGMVMLASLAYLSYACCKIPEMCKEEEDSVEEKK